MCMGVLRECDLSRSMAESRNSFPAAAIVGAVWGVFGLTGAGATLRVSLFGIPDGAIFFGAFKAGEGGPLVVRCPSLPMFPPQGVHRANTPWGIENAAPHRAQPRPSAYPTDT